MQHTLLIVHREKYLCNYTEHSVTGARNSMCKKLFNVTKEQTYCAMRHDYRVKMLSLWFFANKKTNFNSTALKFYDLTDT